MPRKNMTEFLFSDIYPLLIVKAEKKGRTQEEADQLINWLTGYSPENIHELQSSSITYGDFFRNAPEINPEYENIQGKICNVQVEEISDPTTRIIRVLDLMIDQLAKGKSIDKITHPEPVPKTIEEYIETAPQQSRKPLKEMNRILSQSLPEAEPRISWKMPTYWKNRNLVQFAAFSKHLGFYPGPEAIEAFQDELKDYKTSKGAIQFPYNKQLPDQLIEQIANWVSKHQEKKN